MPIDQERTRAEYVARVNAIVDYIPRHLEDDLSLAALAEEAGFSHFHFHRIFAGVVGEPLHAFVRRMRLERAALDLGRQPDRSITDIALDCGFSSSANFSRAFKEAFGLSAREFRQARVQHPDQARAVVEAIEARIRRGAATVQANLQAARRQEGHPEVPVTLTTFPPVRLAYLRHFGPYEERHKIALFRGIRAWAAAALPAAPAPTWIGICYGDRGLLDKDRRRYDAGVVLPEGFTGPVAPPAVELVVPGGLCAVLRHPTTGLMICEAWTSLHRDWLPGSGYVPDDRPCLERFPAGWPPLDGTPFPIDVCQAIRPGTFPPRR